MVIKTETCFFTELKVFPGHGRRLVRKDGKLLVFIDRKSRSLYTQKKKAQVLRWTQAWRRKNKKSKTETAAKRKGKKTARVFKSIQGISMEDLQSKRDMKPEQRKAAKDVAIREKKEKEKKAVADKKKTAAAGAKAKKPVAVAASAAFVKVPKSRRVTAKPVASGKK